MTTIAVFVADLSATAIIYIGTQYAFSPRTMMPSFGLPHPALDDATINWLRLKGVRDIVSGLVVFTIIRYGTHQLVGMIMLVEALIPLGDMSTILYGRGSTSTALGVHGLTAAVMVLAGMRLVSG